MCNIVAIYSAVQYKWNLNPALCVSRNTSERQDVDPKADGSNQLPATIFLSTKLACWHVIFLQLETHN